MKLTKTSFLFIIFNILLLVFGFYSLNNWLFLNFDNWLISRIYPFFQSTYQNSKVKWADNVILLKIDEKFFDKMWVTVSTFHRWYYAMLLKKLQTYWVKNVVFDVFFWELKYWTWYNKLQKIYNKSLEIFDRNLASEMKDNIVLWVIPYLTWFIHPSNKFIVKDVWLWYVESHTNKWQVNDWVIPYVNYNSNKLFALWISAYLNRLYKNKVITNKIDSYIEKNNSIFKLDYLVIKTSNSKFDVKIPLSKDVNWVNYIFTPLFFWKIFPQSYSVYDILTDDDNVYKDLFQWKTVIVWATDKTLNDVKLSYVWLIPWVMFHVNTFLSVYWRNYMYVLPIWKSFLILLLIFLISYVAVLIWKDEKISIIVFTVITLFISNWFYLLFLNGVVLPMWTMLTMVFLKIILDVFHILSVNEERKRFFRQLFDKYVWSKVRREKEQNKWKSAQKKEVAIFFSDIDSFTNISEQLTAQEVVDMLNIYFEIAWKPISLAKWYVDKYIWDAIMAFWDDLPNTDLVLKSVLIFQKSHLQIIKKIEENLWKKIIITTRVWLHYWNAVVWDVWDINNKISYTVIWDSVNLASRLEWINKYYWTRVIMSEKFYNKLLNKDNFAIRLIDKITVKWKTKPVKIYQLMLYYTNEITDEIKKYILIFEKWLDLYFKWDFQSAKDIFEKLLMYKKWQADSVLKVFIDRINYLLKYPPKNWDGVWKFKTK